MEKITNYKMGDFLKLDVEKVTEYLMYLELLPPAKEIANPKASKKNKVPKIIQVKDVRDLTFGQVSVMRTNFQTPNEQSVFENISLVTELKQDEILNLPIIDFYGVLASITKDLTDISNMEENALGDDEDDDTDISYLAVNASQRMSKFGILNAIDSLAGGDITKWKEIENMPYMTVFTKLVMQKTRNDIERDVARLQRQKQQNN